LTDASTAVIVNISRPAGKPLTLSVLAQVRHLAAGSSETDGARWAFPGPVPGASRSPWNRPPHTSLPRSWSCSGQPYS